ncbi:MAG: dihydrolipoamide acetyltransferase family protein [Flavobacteriaceae bacterium]|nr:dihydrolipoamide acetyltransferase family protein [Flavobacteriaceae bacterium]MDG1962029.1 dihydrolipoamide acetyltransferase family protein [Flavobacteriaceae bacterium]
MARFELKLPKMGESVAEATVINWLKQVGDAIEMDEPVLEIATDKVDSEVPSEVSGILVEQFFAVDDVVKVGEVLAVIETETSGVAAAPSAAEAKAIEPSATIDFAAQVEETITSAQSIKSAAVIESTDARFYSPLVKNMASAEGISQQDLDAISGTGKDGRVTKNDMLSFLTERTTAKAAAPKPLVAAQSADSRLQESGSKSLDALSQAPSLVKAVSPAGGDEIIEMTRMGKLIASHMVNSVSTSAHVQSFVECDVTKIWQWRARINPAYLAREGEKLTFTPIFMEAVVKALKDFPMMNISVDGDKIIKHRAINLGMAAALDDGNLIVPVIKNADQLNLVGMSKAVNDLATRARQNKLKPDEISGGTYTVTNVGNFGSIMGTPIINQPQVGILALGAIRKVPAVIETDQGDFIGIRYKMFLSHSYDHRVVNGALGGMFVKRVADYLEAWDAHREV